MSISGLCIEVYKEIKRRLAGDCQCVNIALLVRETEDGEEVILQPAAYQDLKGKWCVVNVGMWDLPTSGMRGGNSYTVRLSDIEEAIKNEDSGDSQTSVGGVSGSA